MRRRSRCALLCRSQLPVPALTISLPAGGPRSLPNVTDITSGGFAITTILLRSLVSVPVAGDLMRPLRTMAAAPINLDHPGTYLHWSIFTVSVANLCLIAIMVVIFGAALLLPFPKGRTY